MLKLNASYSKKVPAEGEYTSQSYHVDHTAVTGQLFNDRRDVLLRPVEVGLGSGIQYGDVRFPWRSLLHGKRFFVQHPVAARPQNEGKEKSGKETSSAGLFRVILHNTSFGLVFTERNYSVRGIMPVKWAELRWIC